MTKATMQQPAALAPLCEDPTKEQESAHLAAFIAQLPRYSYLRAYLSDAVEVASDSMRGDMSIDLMSELRRRRNELLIDITRYEDVLKNVLAKRDVAARQFETFTHRAAQAANYAKDAANALATCQRDFIRVTESAQAMRESIEK